MAAAVRYPRLVAFSLTTRLQPAVEPPRLSRVYCCLRQNRGATQTWKSRLFSRGFRTKKSQSWVETGPSKSDQGPSLLKPFLYTSAVCVGTFAGAMIINYESMRKVFQDLQSGKRHELESPKTRSQKAIGFREHLNVIWSGFSNGQKLILGIVACNLSVFLLWRLPAIQSTMIRYFSSAINHPVPSMTLSSFSHISFLHLFVNMYVLWSFASVGVNMFGMEQFGAFYLSAGTFSSFASIAALKLLKRPMSVSVGASGAIMGLIGAVCVKYPNAQLSIAFVSEIWPHSFSADTGMKCLIAFDFIGLVLGWRFLDHAGHLGGMLFGLLYTKYGSQYVWGNREKFMKWWHNIRGKP